MAQGPSAYDLRQERLRALRRARNGKVPGVSGQQYYTVQAGDSWFSIAEMFGGDQRKGVTLANMNGYDAGGWNEQGVFEPGSVLRAGARIAIPSWINGNFTPYISGSRLKNMDNTNQWSRGKFEGPLPDGVNRFGSEQTFEFDVSNPDEWKYVDLTSGGVDWDKHGSYSGSENSATGQVSTGTGENTDWTGVSAVGANAITAKFGQVTEQPGYDPAFYQNPKNIVLLHNLIQTLPEGQAPEWLDVNAVEDTYNYMQIRNWGKPPEQWGYLPTNDPYTEMLARVQAPPAGVFDTNGRVVDINATNPQAGDGAMLDWTNPQFDWLGLSQNQKGEVLNAPGFDIHNVDTSQAGLIRSDPVFVYPEWRMREGNLIDQAGFFLNGDALLSAPWFQKLVEGALSSPNTAPAVGALVAGGTVGGGVLTKVLIGGGTLVAGYGAQVGTGQGLGNLVDPSLEWLGLSEAGIKFGKVNQILLEGLNYAAQKVEQGGGTASAMTYGMTDKISNKPLPMELAQNAIETAKGIPTLLKIGQAVFDDPTVLQRPLNQILTKDEAKQYNAMINSIPGLGLFQSAVQIAENKNNLPNVVDLVTGIAAAEVYDFKTRVLNVDASASWDSLNDGQKTAFAIWQANKVYYDVNDLNKQKRETVWVLGKNEAVAVKRGYTIDDAVQRIKAGESPEVVIEDYRREYGLSGQATDFLIQSIADPINMADGVASTARVNFYGADAAKFMKAADAADIASIAARTAGDIPKAESLAKEAVQARAKAKIAAAHKLANQMKKSLLGDRALPGMKSETGRVFEALSRSFDSDTRAALNKGDQWLAGLADDGTISAIAPKDAPANIKAQGWLRKTWIGEKMGGAWDKVANNWLFQLTPEAKAIISIDMAKENLSVLMDWIANDENLTKNLGQTLEALANQDYAKLREMGATFLDNPEFATVIGAVKDFLPKLKELNANYDLAALPRKRFMQLLEIDGGGHPAGMLKIFTEGDPEVEFNRLVTKARGLDTEAARSFLAAVDSGEVTAKSLSKDLSIFKDNRVSVYPQEHKAVVKAYFEDHMGKWAVDRYSVVPSNQFNEVLRGMKGAQSLLLLDMSSSYLINNFIGNRVHMATEGVFGMNRAGERNAFMEAFGVEPARYGEGLGAAQLEGEVAAGSTLPKTMGTEAPKGKAAKDLPISGEARVAEAGKGSGLASKAADAISAVRRKVGFMSMASAAVEKSSSQQMYYSAMRSFYGRQWRAGVGFSKMPEVLSSRLRAMGIDPEVVYANVEGYMSAKDFNKLVNGVTNRTVDTYLNDAATGLGKNPGEAKAMLAELGLLDELTERIGKATTQDEVKAVFEDVRTKAAEKIEQARQRDLIARAQHVSQKVATEGPAGVVDAFDRLEDDYYRVKLENDQLMAETSDKISVANNKDLVNVFWTNAKTKQAKMWRSAQDHFVATLKGIMDAFHMDTPEARRMVENKRAQFKLYEDYFAEQWRAADDFFNGGNKAGQTYDAFQREWNQKFYDVQGRVLEMEKEFTADFVTVFGAKFGENGGALARAWRESVNAISGQMREAMFAHRNGLIGKDRTQRNMAWQQFSPEYQKMWEARTKANIDGAGEVYKGGEVDSTPVETGKQPTAEQARAVKIEETKQRVAAEAQQVAMSREEHRTAVYGVADRYGIPTANADGTPVVGMDVALLKIIQEYGGPNSPQWRRFDEVPLDVVERAFEEYNLRGGMGDKPMEQVIAEMAREDVSGYPDDTQKIQDAYDEATDRLKTIQQEIPTELPDGESIQTEPIEVKAADFGNTPADPLFGVTKPESVILPKSLLNKALRLWNRYLTESPFFLNWFGDYRAKQQLAKYKGMTPILVKPIDAVVSGKTKEVKTSAFVEYRKYQNTSITNNDTGAEILFPKSGFDESFGGPSKKTNLNAQIVRDLPTLLENAIHITSELPRDSKVGADIIHHYATKAMINGELVDIAFTVIEWHEKKINYYDSFVVTEQLKKDTSARFSGVSRPVATSDSVKFNLSYWLENVNPHSAVVDPSGKPLVVFSDSKSLPDVMPDGGYKFINSGTAEAGGYYLNARNLATAEQLSQLGVDGLRAAGYDGVQTADGYIVFDREQFMGVQAKKDKNPNALYQEGGDMPLLPVGGYDQTSGFMEMGNILHDGWLNEVKPLLDTMEDMAGRPEQTHNFAGMDADTNKLFNGWLNQVRGEMANVKHQTLRWGETSRDNALLNYGKQYGFDKLLNAVMPYQFYMTRTGFNWIVRVMDRPAYASMYARFRNLQNTYKNQYPERMRNKIRIPQPFLPEGWGGGVWVNMQPQLIPFSQFLQPFDSIIRDENMTANSAYYTLMDWEQNGDINEGEAMKAYQTQSGPLWERAMEQTKMDDADGNTAMDYFSTLVTPALYLTLPYYLATKKKMGDGGWPAGNLPNTRMGNALKVAFQGTNLEPVGDIAGGLLAKPEEWLRDQYDLPKYGEFTDFYVDRALANLVVEGKYSVQEVEIAMIDRTGPAFDEAMKRVGMEQAMRTPGFSTLYAMTHGEGVKDTVFDTIGSLAITMFPGAMLPEAEMEYKGLKQEYNLAYQAKDAGNAEAVNKFYDDHPEYAARLALRKDPEQRLNNFLQSAVWDIWGKLDAAQKKQADAYLGPYLEEFLDKEPEVILDPDRLANLAQILGQMLPKDQQPVLPEAGKALLDESLTSQQIPQLTPELNSRVNQFLTERKTQFPMWYQENTVYNTLPKSEQAAYMMTHPEYKKYLDWNQEWYDTYPDMVPYFRGDNTKTIDTTGWSPVVVEMATYAAVTGDDLPDGARKMLYQYWQNGDGYYDDFDSWLKYAVFPALANGNKQFVP